MHFLSLNVVNFFVMQHGVTETGVGNPVIWETDLLLLTYSLSFFLFFF